MIEDAPVDGFDPQSKTVYQYHSCRCHGCPKHCTRYDAAELYEKILAHDQNIRDEEYNLVVIWECDAPKEAKKVPSLKNKTRPIHMLSSAISKHVWIRLKPVTHMLSHPRKSARAHISFNRRHFRPRTKTHMLCRSTAACSRFRSRTPAARDPPTHRCEKSFHATRSRIPAASSTEENTMVVRTNTCTRFQLRKI